VLDGAALIMRAVAEGGASAAAPLREAALTEGAMLHHMLVAVSSAVSSLLRRSVNLQDTIFTCW
jgi:hypothetical protein